MKKLDTTPSFFDPEEAEELATALTEDDDEGWTYRAKHDPKGTGYSLVEVYDEDGHFVAKL